MRWAFAAATVFCSCALGLSFGVRATRCVQEYSSLGNGYTVPGLDTDFSKSAIDLQELDTGGVGKDAVRSIDVPLFVTCEEAEDWMSAREPVIAVRLGDEVKAFPLQIMVWHEIVNDSIGGTPVAVTFCPLCYSAIVFDARVSGRTLTFGASGLLRFSNLVIYDRQTESLWQQITGEAIVGDFVGAVLKKLPSQIISFDQFKDNYPGGLVLARPSNTFKPYGRNPYSGYDDVQSAPLMYSGALDPRIAPMERIVVVEMGTASKAYPYTVTLDACALNDSVGGVAVAIFHLDGATSAVDAADVSVSRHVGSTGVFRRNIAGRELNFVCIDGEITDVETQTRWSITGEGLSGPLAGEQLEPVVHGDFFSFAWFAFNPGYQLFHMP